MMQGLWGFVVGVILLGVTDAVDYTIETRVFVDQRAFNSWKSKVAATIPDAQKDSVTKTAMEKYIKAAFNDMNSMFKGLSTSGINLDARIVGNIEFVSETIFTGTSMVKDANNILDEFEAWLGGKNLPSVDHTMLFTGLDMSLNGNKDNLGIANLGEMCDPSGSLSVMEAVLSGSVTATMTHELGHSLSAEHDGDGNACTNGNFIMKANEDAEMATKDNFKFSTCSVNYFRNYLNSGKGDCLKQTTAPKLTSSRLGALFTPDMMCQFVEGAQSSVCRGYYGSGGDPYSSLCLSVMCQEAGKDTCVYMAGADGTVCGKGKRCSLGSCVADASLSTGTATDACPLGDSPLALTELKGKTCSQAVATDKTVCQDDVIRRSCCKSCEGVQSAPSDAECKDKAAWCSRVRRPGCYGYENTCCATCKKLVVNAADPSCKYGDKARWCRRLGYWGCMYNRKTCCQKCASVKQPDWYGSGSGSWYTWDD